ncbi:radial spoke head 1 homolog [Nasonia vitripennis]|uniref:Radial spoke head 1 homolog n=1 Tax=Nasonia vitripennis TaxID=7425 RepID=A0A7M7G3Y4_NASVI|nr:radial spoke head 1 homolog [Nasonia vitripennis]XP_031780721.1 radial spoke head 1 homolog [Nasonia vitripennis]
MSEDESVEATESAESEVQNPLGSYEGERNKSGERHGFGRYLLANGDTYEGEYCRGLRHGHGLYVFKLGARYEGQWRRGQKHGRGSFVYPDGTRYEGEWKRDKRCGFGAYHYRNGDVYEGTWRQDYRHGLGSYTYADGGCKFYGSWIADRMQGIGQLTHQRHRYHGFWETNLPQGRGCYIFENGSMLHGHFLHILDTSGQIVTETDEAAQEPEISEEEPPKEDTAVDAKELRPEPLKQGIVAVVWRSRRVTPYSSDLMPPEPAAVIDQGSSMETLNDDVCDETDDERAEEYLKRDDYEVEYEDEYVDEEAEDEENDYLRD